jgi:DNA-binding SARP family transcriptional activator
VERGDQEAALSFLELLASTRPLDEHLHRVLIEALAGLGRRWEAIESYERLRDALEEEYAAEPEPETKVLYRRLLSGNKPMPASTPHNLPGVDHQLRRTSTFAHRANGRVGTYAAANPHRCGRCWEEPTRQPHVPDWVSSLQESPPPSC